MEAAARGLKRTTTATATSLLCYMSRKSACESERASASPATAVGTVDLDGISNSIRGNKRALGSRATEGEREQRGFTYLHCRSPWLLVCLFALTGMESNYHCRSLCTAASLSAVSVSVNVHVHVCVLSSLG